MPVPVANLPPGPTTPPLILAVNWLRRPLAMLDEAAATYGDVFSMRMLGGVFVNFSTPDAIRDIFTADPDVLRAGEANAILEAALGKHSLLLLDGDHHLQQRRLMLPPFHGERMRSYTEAMTVATERSIRTWPIGQPFALHPQMQDITLEVIIRAVFGIADGDQLAAMRTAITRWTSLGTAPLATALLLAVPPAHAHYLATIAEATLKLGRLELPIGRLAPWSGVNRAKAVLDALLHAEIAARRGSSRDREDVLSMLIEARDDHGAAMTADELHGEMLTLLIAGHETSATTLAWTVHNLLAHPEALDRVYAELDEVVGGDRVAPHHLPRLVWLDAVIKETLRLTPILPAVGRKVARPTRIGGVDLPAGVFAIACIYLTHRRAEQWPDPTRFDPSRFLDRKADPYSYYPFGGGTRRCLGMAFANHEIKVVLATMLSRLALQRAAGPPVTVVRRGITFAPSGGTPVIARVRRPA